MAKTAGLRHHGHMSSFLRPGVRLAGLALALGVASCGVSTPPAPESPAASASTGTSAVERGVVVGLRPLAQAPASESRQRAMAQLLRVSTGTGPALPSSAVEVIVRLEHTNRDVAFVRGAEEGFRLGQRVTLTGGDRPELQRGG